MTWDLLSALLLFAFVSTITPGPNNLMLLASGANFGFRRTLPHMFGILFGVAIMVVLIGAGLMQLFDLVSWSYDLLKILCIGYMIYLAYRIANTGSDSVNGEQRSKPFSLIQAALFQWVNPKAWTMALTAITVYSPTRSVEGVLIVAAAFASVNLPSISVWVILGKQIKKWLSTSLRLKWFNRSMAVMLLTSLYPVLNL